MSKKFHSQRGNTFVGLFVGLVLGVVIAAGVVWYLNRSHSPFQNKDSALHPAEKPKDGGPAGAAESLPAKPGDKQRFDFYNILPGGQDAAPAPKAAPSDAAADAQIQDKGKMYRVRSGPYNKADEMNRVRAQMSQGGIQATVVKIKE